MEYVYAALLLHKLEQPVSEENMKKVISATGAQVDEAKVKTLLAALQGVDIAKELENASAVVATPVAGGSAGGDAGAGEAEKEEKKEDEGPSESAAGLSSLFG